MKTKIKTLITAVFLLLTVAVAQSQTLDSSFWVPNAAVYAITTTDSFTYIGGAFNLVGPYTGHGVCLTGTDGLLDLAYPEVNSGIETVVPDGSGGWYIGGFFTKVGTYTKNYIAHINADKTVDATWNPDANGYIRTIAVSGSDIYVGGGFDSIGGQARNFIAKLNNTTGAVDTAWNPDVSGDYYSVVTSIAISGNDIYVGGNFQSVGGEARNFLAKLNNITGGADTIWNPNMPYYDTEDYHIISAIVISGSDIYVCGAFDSIGGQTRRNIAKLNSITGDADTTWNQNNYAIISAIVISGNDIYVGGGFDSIGGQARNNIAKLNDITGDADTTWNPNADGTITTMSINGNDIYVGGCFNSIGGQARRNIARLNNTTGEADITWNPNTNATVYTMSANENDIYVGGGFFSVNGQFRNHIAKLNNATGEADTLWNPNVNAIGNVSAISISGSDIYVGGGFDSIGGQYRKGIAKLNSTTGAADVTWNPNANGYIKTIAISGSDIYVSGGFDSIGGQYRKGIAKLNNISGNADLIWNSNVNPGYFGYNEVKSIAISGNDIYVGGNFDSIGGQYRPGIAKLNNTTGAVDLTWVPNAGGNILECSVLTIALDENDIYAGGWFVGYDYMAKFNNITGIIDPTWNPNIGGGVRAMVISGNDIYAGGELSINNGNDIAKLNNTTGAADITFDPNIYFNVDAIAINGDDIYIGGLNDWSVRPYFAKFFMTAEVNIAEAETLNSSVSLYPNPVSDNLNVDFTFEEKTYLQISILNITGQLINTEILNKPQGNYTTSVKMNDLQTGIYIVKIQSDIINHQFKIIKID